MGWLDLVKSYDPQEARDERGRWTDTGRSNLADEEWRPTGPADQTRAEALGRDVLKGVGIEPKWVNFSKLKGSDIWELNMSFGGPGSGLTVHWPKDGSLYCELATLDKEDRGKGLGKKVMAAMIDLAEKTDCNGIDLYASLSSGGYVWSKFGFEPRDPLTMAKQIMQRVRKGQLDGPPLKKVGDILKADGPRMAQKLSDLDEPVSEDLMHKMVDERDYNAKFGKPTLGKALLLGTDNDMTLPRYKFKEVRQWAMAN